MAWMYAIAKNTAKMYLRKHTKEVTVEEDIEIAYHQQDVISNVTDSTFIGRVSCLHEVTTMKNNSTKENSFLLKI